ncbi:MAG: SCP2 sterol-binding domain-containing protein [Thermoplasmata archaeon]|nr:SCP2 sterol-binding domain-containing protein [Thermoplasmata archaeon]
MFETKEEASEFVEEFFRRQLQDEEIRDLWLGLRTVVAMNITDHDLWLSIDTRSQGDLTISRGEREDYDLLLRMSMATFHGIYTGRQGIVSSFALRKIRTKGSVGVIMKTTWSLPRAIGIYKQLCQERGVPIDPKKKRGEQDKAGQDKAGQSKRDKARQTKQDEARQTKQDETVPLLPPRPPRGTAWTA